MLADSLARACAASVPIVPQDALDLIDGMVAFLDFQSDLEFLQTPPPGYLVPGTDLLGLMQTLRNKVSSGAITGEYDFEAQFTSILSSAHDGHLYFSLDGSGVFQYGTQFDPLVSVSLDGVSPPQIYFVRE